jgi:hypothetical protein
MNLSVAAASVPTAMPALAAVSTLAAMPSEAAMLTEPAMLADSPMPMRKTMAPATVIPAIAPVVSVSTVNVTNGRVPNGLCHASGQGKTHADQQQDRPPQYSTVIHLRLRFP